jgi:hypothetical protein
MDGKSQMVERYPDPRVRHANLGPPVPPSMASGAALDRGD